MLPLNNQFCLLLLFLSHGLLGQLSVIDSLKRELQVEREDTIRVNQLCDLAFRLRQIDPDSTLLLSAQALEMSRKLDFKRGISRAYYSQGVGHHIKGQYDSAMAFYNQGMDLALETSSLALQSRFVNNIGLIHWNRGDYARALEQFHRSLSLDQQLQDEYGECRSLNNIGLVYRSLSQFKNALDYLQRAFNRLEILEDQFGMAQCSHNIGLTLTDLDRYEDSKEYFKNSIELSSSSGVICHQVYPLVGLAQAFLETGRADSALFYAHQVFQKPEDCREPKNISTAYQVIGLSHLKRENYQKAEEALLKSYEISDRVGFESASLQTTETLYDLYRRIGKTKLAFEYNDIHKSIKDSLHNDEVTLEIARLEAVFEYEKEKEKLILEQEKEELAYQSQLRRRELILYAVTGGTVLLLAFFINLYLSLQRKKRDNGLIVSQKQKLEELAEMKDRLTSMIAHDMKNMLNTIIGYSSGHSGDKKMRGINQSGNAILNLVSNMLDVQRFEEASMTLQTRQCRLSDLLSVSEMHVQALLDSKNIQLDLEVSDGLYIKADKDIMTRVLTNLMINAIKYSPVGKTIKVSAGLKASDPSWCYISVTDEGGGIDEDDLDHVFDQYWQSSKQTKGKGSIGLGLAFCKIAVEAHQGSIHAISDNNGATLLIELPVEGQLVHDHDRHCSETKEALILEQEIDLLATFHPSLKELEVFEIGEIRDLLEEMEQKGIRSRWKSELQSAVFQGNEEAYQDLLAQLVKT